jgi:hypothetical protein
MKNNANDINDIGNSLQKYISKYNLEQVQPIVQLRLIIFILKTGPAAIVQSGLWSKKYGTCAIQ